MKPILKIKSITKKWIINNFLVIVGIVAVTEVVLGIITSNYFVSAVRESASQYTQSFDLLALYSGDVFEEKAIEFAETFENKDKLEVQIFDATGKVVATTSGFSSEVVSKDIEKLDTETLFWVGKMKTGESVMIETIKLQDMGNGTNGYYRWIVSLEKVYKYQTIVIIIAVLVGLGIILIAATSGLYFIKSIVRPVIEVTSAARKIAMGNFSERIEVKDVDEIGELCDTINYMATELDRVDNMKNDFISSVSHELRTPLTAIRGWGETVMMSVGVDNEVVKKGIDVILKESDRLSQLVEDLLDFSRMQSGKLKVEIEKAKVVSILQQAIDMYKELANQQNIQLTYLDPGREYFVMADKNRIKQVFINIIDNAIKYSFSGGNVMVSVEEEEGCIRIIVSDTGVGIATADIEHVKEKFFKANKSVRGSGIGLAVADEIVKQHNGLLFIESQEGGGTTVTIVLPITEKDEEEKVTAIYYPPQNYEGEQVEPVDSLEEIESTSAENSDM